jgi:hypothetical protein
VVIETLDISEELIAKICSYVRLGANIETSAQAEGVPPDILNEWLCKADKSGGIYEHLKQELDKARAQGEILHIQRIVSQGSARESQWILERMSPEKWGPTLPAKKTKKQSSILKGSIKR